MFLLRVYSLENSNLKHDISSLKEGRYFVAIFELYNERKIQFSASHVFSRNVVVILYKIK